MHLSLKELYYHLQRELWPDQEYYEDADDLYGISTLEEFKQMIRKCRRGYRFPLVQCPSFRYRTQDEARAVYAFSNGPDWLSAYAPLKLQRRIQKAIEQKAIKREREAAQPWHPPVHVHIFFDGTRSVMAIGE